MRKNEIDHILTRMLDSHKNVSDLNLTVGKPPQVESSGILLPVEMRPAIKELTPFQTEVMALNLINGDRRLTRDLLEKGSCDLSHSLPGKARFRVNIFSQTGNYSIVLRKLESKVPTIKTMNLPESFYDIAKEKNGIVLFTGATGSGKTTSLAAILDKINEEESVHVVTLEDPVEYLHPHKKSTFNQRELGLDFDSSHDLTQPANHWERYLYFNAGWFCGPCPHRFGARFLEIALTIRDDPPEELLCQPLDPWLDQVALPLAIHALGGGRPGPELAGMDGDVTCHYRMLPLLYARESDRAVAAVERAVAPNPVKKLLKAWEPARRMIYQGRGHKARALFDQAALPAREEPIRRALRQAGLWIR